MTRKSPRLIGPLIQFILISAVAFAGTGGRAALATTTQPESAQYAISASLPQPLAHDHDRGTPPGEEPPASHRPL